MSKYGKILIVICVVDLISTIFLIEKLDWGEANPILKWCFTKHGIWGLAGVKIFMNTCSIFILELTYVSLLVHKKYYIFTICVYGVVYVSGLFWQFF